MLTSFEVPETAADAPPGLQDLTDNYGARVRGYFHPPTTGQYTFWITSDDESRLYLSLQGSASRKVEIARVLAFTNPNE